MKILLSTLLLFTLTGSAQTKMLTMEEAVRGQKTYLAPQKLEQLGWNTWSGQFYYIENDQLIIGNVPDGKKTVKTTLEKINSFTNPAESFSSFPLITWRGPRGFEVRGDSKTYVFGIEYLKKDNWQHGDEANFDESGIENIAFTKANNLFIHLAGSGDVQVTKDADKNIVNGQSVHREEWGISKGTFWSPQGNYLAFYRMDQTMVTDYPIIDFTSHPAQNENIKYPMAGGKSHHVTLGVYDLKSGKIIFLKTGGDPEHYLTNICWSPDEKYIYIAELNRAQNEMKFNCYNAMTGDLERTLFEEKNDKYVHPMHTMLFVKTHPDEFIWQSERDGFNNLYLYKTDGTLLRKLTNYYAANVRMSFSMEVFDLAGFDEKGDNVFYIGINSNNKIGREVRMASLDGKSDVLIAGGDGCHSVILNSTGKYLIDTYSSPTVPRRITIIDKKGKVLQTLLDAPNPLRDYKLGQIRLFTIKAADNTTDLFCRMILPIDFDSTKKYPAIVYLYNGPNVQLVTNTWLYGSDLWYQYMAEHGFIVFTLDGRGSGNRGLKFEQITFRHLGAAEMDDQLKGVDYLKSKSYVDQSRMGVFGWSYGGFMATSLMTRHPGVFKCAVAGGPVIDWSYYEVMYTERYMDTPQENPDGYKENCVLNYAGNLKGKLLLIHGTSDPVVVWQHSLLFLEKCVETGSYPDYLVYPGHEHNVLGKDRTHLFGKITEYFMQNL
jgi:dipeptidyl-peptidase-4